MSNAEFIQSEWSITITVVLCAVASYWCWVGAMRGMLAHRIGRVVLSCGVTTITLGFAALLFFDYFAAASISRVGLWVTAVGLSWSAITGIRAGNKMREADERLDRLEEVIEALGGSGGENGG
jgi:hypothetical protein